MLLLGQAPGEGVLGTLRPPRKGEIDFDTFRCADGINIY
jgi:hypothetical protein